MITEKELQFIATHWLLNQYLSPYIWGESLTKANPETYLYIYRGVQFTFNKLSTCIIPINLNRHFFISIYSEWIEFCGYINYTEYEYAIKYNSKLLREKITYLLQNNLLSTERIYIL